MAQIKFLPLKELVNFIYWWSALMPLRILNQTKSLLIVADENLMLGQTIRLWIAIEPLFGDYTKGGRLVGFFLRGMRIAASILAYLVIFLGGLGLLVIWYIAPIWAIAYLF
jgi:hypothetical protein